MKELGHQDLASSNKLMDVGNDHQWLLTPEKEGQRNIRFLLMEVHNTFYKCGFDQKKKTKSVPEEDLTKHPDQSTQNRITAQRTCYVIL